MVVVVTDGFDVVDGRDNDEGEKLADVVGKEGWCMRED